MKYWIVPCKESIYLIDVSLKANRDNKTHDTFVDWRQSNDFAVGDIVYIYKTSPVSCICYNMEVVAVGVPYDESTDNEIFWKDKSVFYEGLGSHKYVRFRLLMEYPSALYTLNSLRQNGLRGNIQSVMECKNEQLLAFLTCEFHKDEGENKTIEATSTLAYTEGELHEVLCNKYERNTEARKACVLLNGCSCAVCGMDFESIYGVIGRGFIHVHHIVPISSIGKTYHVNPAIDLVPVCPNCHNMLHRKEPPYTVEELQKIIGSKKMVGFENKE